MSSVKNAIVVVLLLGVSYGAFQVINAPDPTISDEVEALDIQIGPRIDDAGLADSPPPAQMDLPSRPNSPLAKGEAVPGDSVGPNERTMLPLKPDMAPPILENNSTSVSQFEPPATIKSNDPAALAKTAPLTMDSAAPQPSQQTVEDSNDVALGGTGQFQAIPKTSLEPITPKVQPDTQPKTGIGAEAAGSATVNISPSPQTSNPPVNDSPTSTAITQPEASVRAFANEPEARITEVDWKLINQLVAANQPKNALLELSRAYRNLPQSQRSQKIIRWLDALAGKVIYSTEHFLESDPYLVRADETLQSIAADWKVPAELVYNINRSKIGDPNMLVAGTELKVVRGPFNAEVSMQRQELTLFLNGMYAGRFPLQIGTDQPLTQGRFGIKHKQPGGREYRDALGQSIPAGSPNNPYGKFWIGLDGDMCIHEAGNETATNYSRGCIRLSSQDAADVYGILSEQSQVTIKR